MPTIRIPGSAPGGGAVPNLPQVGAQAEADARVAQAIGGGLERLAQGVSDRDERVAREKAIATEKAERAEAKAQAAAERTDRIVTSSRMTQHNQRQAAYRASVLNPEADTFPAFEDYFAGARDISIEDRDRLVGAMATEQGRTDADAHFSALVEPNEELHRLIYANARVGYEENLQELEEDAAASAPPPMTLGPLLPEPDTAAFDLSLQALGPEAQAERLALGMSRYNEDVANGEVANLWLLENSDAVLNRITDPRSQANAQRVVDSARRAVLASVQALLPGPESASHQAAAVQAAVSRDLAGLLPADREILAAAQAERSSRMIGVALELGMIDPILAQSALLGVAVRQATVDAAVIQARELYEKIGDPKGRVRLDARGQAQFSAVWPTIERELGDLPLDQKADRFNEVMRTFGMNLPNEASNWLQTLDLQSSGGVLVMAEILAPYVGGPLSRLPQTLDRQDANKGVVTVRDALTEENFRLASHTALSIMANMPVADAIALARAEQALAHEEETKNDPELNEIREGRGNQVNAESVKKAINGLSGLPDIDLDKPGGQHFAAIVMRFARAEVGRYPNTSTDLAINSAVTRASGLFWHNKATNEWEFLNPRIYEAQTGMVEDDIEFALESKFPGREFTSDDYTLVPVPNTDTPLNPSTYSWLVLYADKNGVSQVLNAKDLYKPEWQGSVMQKREAVAKLLDPRDHVDPNTPEGRRELRDDFLRILFKEDGFRNIPELNEVYEEEFAQAKAEFGVDLVGGDQAAAGRAELAVVKAAANYKGTLDDLIQVPSIRLPGAIGPRVQDVRDWDPDAMSDVVRQIRTYQRTLRIPRQISDEERRAVEASKGSSMTPRQARLGHLHKFSTRGPSRGKSESFETGLGSDLPETLQGAFAEYERTGDIDKFVRILLRSGHVGKAIKFKMAEEK